MADMPQTNHVKFAVSCTPIEALTNENGGIHYIVASEVNASLSGGGNSVGVSAYNGSADNQGYLNGIVNYKEASHSSGGTQLTDTGTPDFIFIRNTGYKYSSATILGAETTDCISVVLQEQGYTGSVKGGYANKTGKGFIHYYEIAWLQPGQGIVLPAGAVTVSITQFGSNAGDLTHLCNTLAGLESSSSIYVRTFRSNGSPASSGNAVEFLAVD